MRDAKGRPSARARILALVVAAGMVVIFAPAIISLLGWLAGLVW